MLILASGVTVLQVSVHIIAAVVLWYHEGRPDFYFSGWRLFTPGGILDTIAIYLVGYGIFIFPTVVILCKGLRAVEVAVPVKRILLVWTLIALSVLPVSCWLEFRTRELGHWGSLLVIAVVVTCSFLELSRSRRIEEV